MTTETDPKPEAIVTPYEPADPLPGVAPEMRHDAGGYWRAEAGRDGEPDWKAEAERRLEVGLDMADAAQDALAERDALRAEVERLRIALECVASTPWMGKDGSGMAVTLANAALGARDAITVELAKHYMQTVLADAETTENAPPAAPAAPPARNDGADGSGEGPDGEAAQGGARRARPCFKVHDLKTWVSPFASVWSGDKPYEIRRNDRNYEVGDQLILREWDHAAEKYVGRIIYAFVTYMTPGGEWGLPSDLCVLGMKVTARSDPSDAARKAVTV